MEHGCRVCRDDKGIGGTPTSTFQTSPQSTYLNTGWLVFLHHGNINWLPVLRSTCWSSHRTQRISRYRDTRRSSDITWPHAGNTCAARRFLFRYHRGGPRRPVVAAIHCTASYLIPPLRRRLPHSASSCTVGAGNSLVLGDDGQIDYAREDRPGGGRS